METMNFVKQPRILVVDDSRSARELIRSFLQKEGYAVTLAEDGKDGVKKFREHPHDLVLMDANMPVVDGYRASAEIRRSAHGADAGIIMITGLEDDESVERAFASGAEEYITKPIRWVVLQHRIRLILNNRFAQEAVFEGRARLEAIVNTAADAIIVINQNGCMESLNFAAEKMFGYSLQEALGQNVSILMPSPYRERHDQYLADCLDPGISKVVAVTRELLAVRKSGAVFPIELTVSEVKLKGRLLFTCILRDITERKNAEEKIFYQANYDALTGIANRTLFMKTLDHSIVTAREKDKRLAVIFVDLDRFKWVNDTLGHGAGDELLQAATKRMQDCLQAVDLVARFGGDEFTVILQNSSLEQTRSVARQMLQGLNNHFLLVGESVQISGSLGVAFFPQDAQDLNGLLKCADEAMYRSKKAGRNMCHWYAGESLVLSDHG